MALELAQLQDELRAGTAHNDDNVRAAVDLLIEHDYWLRNGRFVRAAVVKAQDGHYIAWRKAREAFDQGDFDRSSTSERAVLHLAIALAEDQFRWNILGPNNRAMVGRALMAALGLPT